MGTIAEGLGKFGRFTLQEEINRGGMANIYVATDENNTTYSLRRLHSNSMFDFAGRRQFRRGCEILSEIHDHENIISYIEHGKADGADYLLMEYVEGTNLKILMARGDEILLENVGNILIDMATGLEHMHEIGYIHLDFKPENVLVTRNGAVRVVDFDMAITKPDTPKKLPKNGGTPAYMPPEQLLNSGVDHRSDQFAFGVAAYEILTGQKPFPGETPKAILKAQVDRSKFVKPRQFNPDIPIELERIILKCLEREMENRYPFTSVLVRDLSTALYVE